MSSVSKKYFDWLCDLIRDDPRCMCNSYDDLLLYLYNVEFTYILEMDANRAVHGIELRNRFANDVAESKELVHEYLDDRPCSILEMMVALSFSCEENIMGDDCIGNRTGLWFWNMIDSLGLDNMTDEFFDRDYADEVIDCFLNREYQRNGKGGLFTLYNCSKDLRTVDIWYQLLWYLDENFDFSI